MIVDDECTKEERVPIFVNLTEASGLTLAHLLAVSVFMFILTISFKKLVSYMKNIWKIRGSLESNQFADRLFVMFLVLGNLDHVTHGGPWRYQGNMVLVRPLEDGEDPNTVNFESVPVWAQVTRIPFYLLSKELARKLGKRLGEFICIDNYAIGDLGDKILRARVRIPVGCPLQWWITL